MKITGSIRNDALILYFNGELDHHSAEATRLAVDNMLRRYRFGKVIFELSGLNFIDSSGIGVFYGRRKLIKMDNGRCALVSVNDRIARFISVSGLDKMFEVYGTEDECLEAWDERM